MRFPLICLIFASAPAASAALPDALTPATLGAGMVALISTILAIRYLVENRSLDKMRDELTLRIARCERQNSELQVRRGELERALAQKQAAFDQAEAQRAKSHEALTTLRQQIERVSRIDGQTGVANFQQFEETLGEEIKRAVRQKKPLSVLIGELDFFTEYVDVNGEEKGQQALLTIASSVADTFRRAGDLVARVGAARFAVVLPEADQATGERFAERLRSSVYDMCLPFPSSEAADRVTMSVGLITLPPTRLHEKSNAIARAEAALEHAQSNGCNRVVRAADAA